MDYLLSSAFLVGWLNASIRMTTPYILGTMGELFYEKAGVLNLGIEGTMVLGALVGWITCYAYGSLWLGVIVAGVAGSLLALLFAFFTVTLGANQHVTGLGITFFGSGLAYFLYRMTIGIPLLPSSNRFGKSACPSCREFPC